MESNFVCLGLEILGECSYNPADPKNYFTLGQLVSIIALLLAITQLTKPIILFRIKSHNPNYQILKSLTIFAIICIFIATILPIIPGEAILLLGYPIFWEFLSALIFAVTGIYVINVITKPAEFTPKNAKKYLNTTILFIATGGNEHLNELTEEIYHSISSIFKEARKYDPHQASIAKHMGKNYEIAETTKIAITILDTWSDKSFCESIVCRSPNSAIEIIAELSKDPNPDVRLGYEKWSHKFGQWDKW